MTKHSHVSLKLDTGAVEALFGDPDSKLELQRAVIAEIVRRMFPNYATDATRQIIASAFEDHKTELVQAIKNESSFRKGVEAKFAEALTEIQKDAWKNRGAVKPGKEFQAAIDEYAKKSADLALVNAKLTVDGLIQQAAEKALDTFLKGHEQRINILISRRIDTYVHQEVDRRLAALTARA